jgi:hypothetical protein
VLVRVHAQELAERAAVAVADPEARDHLGDDEAGAVAAGLEAHEPVADPGEGREDEAVRDRQPAEVPAVVQRRHGLEVSGD